jgi:hypothetical protein
MGKIDRKLGPGRSTWTSDISMPRIFNKLQASPIRKEVFISDQFHVGEGGKRLKRTMGTLVGVVSVSNTIDAARLRKYPPKYPNGYEETPKTHKITLDRENR